MFIKRRTLFLMGFLLFSTAELSIAANIEVSGFGDISYGYLWDGPADEADAVLFETHGTDPSPLSQNDGFGNVGIDFTVLAELTDRLTALSEVNLQLERGGSSDIGLDLERVYVDYRINNKFNIQVGSFFTPIGFHNRTLYSRAWLMTSIQIPDFDEEELGFVPSHSTGIHIYGNLPAGGTHSINYAVSLANSRGPDPVTLIINRDEGDRKTVTGLLEWVVPKYRDFRIGLSGWLAELNTFKVGPAYGDSVSISTGEPVKLEEVGFNPYLVLYKENFNLILEYVTSKQRDKRGNVPGGPFDFSAFFGEFSLNLMDDKLHPYVRYDFTKLPGTGGPYLTLRDEDGTLTRKFIPEFNAIMVGVAYDLFALNRIKAELIHNFDGPRSNYGLTIQTAYAF